MTCFSYDCSNQESNPIYVISRNVDYYNRALEIDPNFARAHAGLSVQYHQYSEFGYYPTLEVIPQAKEAALKAKVKRHLSMHLKLIQTRHLLTWVTHFYFPTWDVMTKLFWPIKKQLIWIRLTSICG